jgi:hypothetical protein
MRLRVSELVAHGPYSVTGTGVLRSVIRSSTARRRTSVVAEGLPGRQAARVCAELNRAWASDPRES